MKQYSLFISILALMMAGCNKDNVIDHDGSDIDEGYRPITSKSSPYQNKVYEYIPGPGQFINETVTGGFIGDETTMKDATAYAERRLAERKFVSLGSFGGYIIIGFDHSILNSGKKYDFAILGNAMDTSNEPGIVWVMQDTNRNGKPDDDWYELRGSETGKATTLQAYSVTYYRPSEPGMPVEWTSSDGNSGTVDYLKAYHKQPYYYPQWIKDDCYTLSGTLLFAQNEQDPATGYWSNLPYGWGYADNLGSDNINADGQWAGFKISNAMLTDGTHIDLKYIDFIKVQQGVLAKSGWLGENSCEVFSFADYTMIFK